MLDQYGMVWHAAASGCIPRLSCWALRPCWLQHLDQDKSHHCKSLITLMSLGSPDPPVLNDLAPAFRIFSPPLISAILTLIPVHPCVPFPGWIAPVVKSWIPVSYMPRQLSEATRLHVPCFSKLGELQTSWNSRKLWGLIKSVIPANRFHEIHFNPTIPRRSRKK